MAGTLTTELLRESGIYLRPSIYWRAGIY